MIAAEELFEVEVLEDPCEDLVFLQDSRILRGGVNHYLVVSQLVIAIYLLGGRAS